MQAGSVGLGNLGQARGKFVTYVDIALHAVIYPAKENGPEHPMAAAGALDQGIDPHRNSSSAAL